MEKILVIGSSGHAAVAIEAIEATGRFEIIGLIAKENRQGAELFGYPVAGSDERLPSLLAKHGRCTAVIAIGDNFLRSKVIEQVAMHCPGLSFATVIHPRAHVSRSAVIGEGSVVFAGATINAGVRIGRHCILNTNASIDHFSSLGDYASIAPNAATGGNVTIGDYSAIGIGANIVHGRTIGEHTVIGAGSTVLHDLDSYLVAFGCPACGKRRRVAGEPYL